MSKNIEKALKMLDGLKKERKGYTKDVSGRLGKLYRGKDDKKPDPDTFKESSYLYIRSYPGDIGVRPFSGITFWNSPDINISPVNNLGTYTTELEVGKTYNIRCSLHNRGDLMIPFPKVEFFLTNPTLGFNTTVAKYLGVTQLGSLLLPAGNGDANFMYQVPIEEAGHKCLFARTWSFSPLDKPFDLFTLDPRIDRHVAQKNLNFVPQTVPYSFNIVHQENAFETLEFRALSVKEIMALQHPALLDFEIVPITRTAMLSKLEPVIKSKTERKVSLTKAKENLQFKSAGKAGLDLDRQASILKETEAIIHSVNSGRSSFSDHKKSLEGFKAMNKNVSVTELEITIPDFGLKNGSATGFEIINTNMLNGQIKGGITLIVLGS